MKSTNKKKVLELNSIFYVIVLMGFGILISCKPNNAYKTQLQNPKIFNAAMKQLTDVIVYDIFSPPVASRVYLYPTVAAYTVIQKQNPEDYRSLENQLSGYTAPTNPDLTHVNYNLASIEAFLSVAKALVYSEEQLEAFQDSLHQTLLDNGLTKSILRDSKSYGEQVAKHILNWADKDLYKQTRTYPQYMVREEPQYWKPTPPNYMQGIEPYWNKLRTLVLDSANQFAPAPPKPFDLTQGSPFMDELMEVYKVGGQQNSKDPDIAKFWDCNPYVALHQGHTMFADKKITPGGHWIGITTLATKKAQLDFPATVNAYLNVSVGLFDGFISCWDEKWATLVVRPETVINEFIDDQWQPLLQTPPFPEYTSGHSVISATAAVVLTDLFGEAFDFVDTTEQEFGLPARSFNSFFHASEEAALSRLYGGIHYNMAIKEGYTQGLNVGQFLVQNLQTKEK